MSSGAVESEDAVRGSSPVEVSVAGTPAYVAIGPSPELSITVHRRTFETAMVVSVIVGVLLIVAVVVLVSLYVAEQSKIKPAPHRNLLDDTELNIGAVSRHRNGCPPGFYGEDCHLEQHPDAYVAMGDPHAIALSGSDGDNTLALSGNDGDHAPGDDTVPSPMACAHRCDSKSKCIGFHYSGGECELLSRVVIDENTIMYHPEQQSTLYLKKGERPILKGHVLVAENKHFIPRRPWMKKSAPGAVVAAMGVVHVVDFFPTYVLAGSSIGLYSLVPYASRDYHKLLANTMENIHYRHLSGQPLNLPPHWRHKKIYFMYYDGDSANSGVSV